MGALKHLIPQAIRGEIVDFVDQTLDDGLLKDNLANLTTVGGAILVAVGSHVDGKSGLVLRAAGQAFDDVDGDMARALSIDSKFGAFLDPILDKVKMLIELRTLWKHTVDFEPELQRQRRIALGIIAGKHATNMGLNVTAQLMGLQAHSSNAGRVNLWFDGIAVAAYGASDVSENADLREGLAKVGNIATAVGVVSGGIAIAGYAGQFTSRQV